MFLPAPRELVFELLRQEARPGVTVTARGMERLVMEGQRATSTFVLRDAPGGTRLIHARAEKPGLRTLFVPPDTLRESVEADLVRIRRLISTTSLRP